MFNETHAVMEAITSFDQVPAALNFLIAEVGRLNQVIAERGGSTPEPDQWFNLSQFCDYHPAKPSPNTVYGWVARRVVPHKHDGKKLFFLKSEIDAWLKNKGRKTSQELIQEAATRTSPTRRTSRVRA